MHPSAASRIGCSTPPSREDAYTGGGNHLQEAFYEYLSWKQLLLRYSLKLLPARMLLPRPYRPNCSVNICTTRKMP